MAKKQQPRLYRDAQNDYWESRARRARRILAFRRVVRVVVVAAVVAAVVVGGSYIAHRADPSLRIPGYSHAGQ